MNRTPWQLWDLTTGEPAEGADTAEAMAVLERAMARPDGAAPTPACCTCTSTRWRCRPYPERALRGGRPAARPRPGRRPPACTCRPTSTCCAATTATWSSANSAAIVADRKFLAREGALNFYTLYRCHNYHFKIYGAMFLGQPQTGAGGGGRAGARRSPRSCCGSRCRRWPTGWRGSCRCSLHVLIRFGCGHEIIAEPLPADPELYCVTTAMLHYAKGVAHAATGDLGGGRRAARAVRARPHARVPDTRYLFNNTCLDILAVAAAMLDGEIEYRQRQLRRRLRAICAARSSSTTTCPTTSRGAGCSRPGTRSARCCSSRAGSSEAEAVYRADLGLDGTLSRPCQHPDNVWSLHGYHECLTRLGKREQAGIIGRGSSSPRPAPTCRSDRPATAA